MAHVDIKDPTHIIHQGFTIKEAQEIYGLTVDALYYYEQRGLIAPKRNERNGYRLYGAEDFMRLNVITELKEMGFSLDRIEAYFANHSFASTMRMLNDEVAAIDSKLELLHNAKSNVMGRIQRYVSAVAIAQTEAVVIQHIPERRCLLVSNDLVYYRDMPYLFAKAIHDANLSMGALYSTPAYAVDQNVVMENGCFFPEAVLLYSEVNDLGGTYPLNAGLYATCTFKEAIDQAPKFYKRMLDYIGEQGYEPSGALIEYALIAEYETNNHSEFVTRLEVAVKQKQ